MTRLFGADSSSPVTTSINGISILDHAKNLFGVEAAFWGRYFKSTAASDSIEYRHAMESVALRARNIPVLPVARQTLRVDGTEEDGKADAQTNVDDLIASFGMDHLRSLGGPFLFFLDVENASPSLSSQYYRGWAQTVVQYSGSASGGAFQIRPCVYGNHSDDVTWQALTDAQEAGSPCDGVWIARYLRNGCTELPDWNSSFIGPDVRVGCDVLLWQYAGDCEEDTIDYNLANPNVDVSARLVSKLISP